MSGPSGMRTVSPLSTQVMMKTDELTPREQEVMVLTLEGYSVSQMAKYLFLSPNTIKTHKLRMYRKLDAHDREGLLKAARERGLWNG